MSKFIKVQLLSAIASQGQDKPQWRDRANTEKFANAAEARQFMATAAPRALFVPFSLSNTFHQIQKVKAEAAKKSTMPEEIGTPFRIVFETEMATA